MGKLGIIDAEVSLPAKRFKDRLVVPGESRHTECGREASSFPPAKNGEVVGYFLVGWRRFWLRLRDGWIVAARDDDEPFSDDHNLWQAAR